MSQQFCLRLYLKVVFKKEQLWRDVCLIDSKIKGVRKAGANSRCPLRNSRLYCFLSVTSFQRLQNACASFDLRNYAKEANLLTLNWLNVVNSRKMAVLKMTFDALYDTITFQTF